MLPGCNRDERPCGVRHVRREQNPNGNYPIASCWKLPTKWTKIQLMKVELDVPMTAVLLHNIDLNISFKKRDHSLKKKEFYRNER